MGFNSGFKGLNKLGTSLDNFFSGAADPIYLHRNFVKIVATGMVLT